MRFRALIFTAAAAALAGCAVNQPQDAPGLEGTRWQLVTISGSTLEVPREPVVELRFHDSRVNFHACNGISGRYVQEGTHVAVPRGFVGTRMSCDAPLLALDDAASALFEAGVDFRKEEETLTLQGSGQRWQFRRYGDMPANMAEQPG